MGDTMNLEILCKSAPLETVRLKWNRQQTNKRKDAGDPAIYDPATSHPTTFDPVTREVLVCLVKVILYLEDVDGMTLQVAALWRLHNTITCHEPSKYGKYQRHRGVQTMTQPGVPSLTPDVTQSSTLTDNVTQPDPQASRTDVMGEYITEPGTLQLVSNTDNISITSELCSVPGLDPIPAEQLDNIVTMSNQGTSNIYSFHATNPVRSMELDPEPNDPDLSVSLAVKEESNQSDPLDSTMDHQVNGSITEPGVDDSPSFEGMAEVPERDEESELAEHQRRAEVMVEEILALSTVEPRTTSSGERYTRYTCRQCGCAHHRRSLHIAHLRAHAGIDPYICKICKKTYKTTAGYRIHMVGHSGVRHPCSLCGKSFNNTGNLYTHMRSHDKVKKYVCPTCGHRSSTSSHNLEHQQVHDPVKRFQCTLCGLMFQRQGTLRSHLNRVHGIKKPFSKKR